LRGSSLLFASLLAELGKQIPGLTGWVFGIDRELNLAIRAHHIGVSRGVLILGGARRAIGSTHFTAGVAQQRKRELKLLGEGTIVFDGVERNTANCDPLGRKVLDSITESMALFRSARCIGFGVEPQHDTLACEIREAAFVAHMVHDPKFGSRGASLKHLGTATEDAAEEGTEHEGPRDSEVSISLRAALPQAAFRPKTRARTTLSSAGRTGLVR